MSEANATAQPAKREFAADQPPAAAQAAPKVSFVVPCLDAEDTLPSCIQHLRAVRSPGGSEIIVVDNGSIDRSYEIAKQSADSALLDDTATIAGLRNIGAAAATGDLVVFVDSDCLLNPDWIEIALEHLRDPLVAMVGAKTHVLPKNVGWVARAWKVHLDRTEVDPNPQWLVTRALAVRRLSFVEIGGFDTELETCEDVALGHALSSRWQIKNDIRLAPIHLKDADSLRELFYKERWRGKDSVKTSIRQLFLEQRWDWKEALSLALPFYFLASFCLFPVSLLVLAIHGQTGPLLLALILLLTPILLLSFDSCRKTGRWLWFFPLCVVYAVYVAARVSILIPVAFLRSLW